MGETTGHMITPIIQAIVARRVIKWPVLCLTSDGAPAKARMRLVWLCTTPIVPDRANDNDDHFNNGDPEGLDGEVSPR